MALKIYNSLTGRKEAFKSIEEGKVGIYACGPTVYDDPHIGHIRSAFTFGLVRGYVIYKGYKVCYVRNITDVDDKIIEKARRISVERKGTSPLKALTKEVAEKYLNIYRENMADAGIAPPDIEPKATEHIKDIVKVIEKLRVQGHAYEAVGDV